MIQFRFYGQLLSANHRNKYNSKTGKYFHDKKYDLFLMLVKNQWRINFLMKEKKPLPKPLACKVELHITIYIHRSIDYDNILKIIGDSLNGLAWVDDKQIKVGRWLVVDGASKKEEGFQVSIGEAFLE